MSVALAALATHACKRFLYLLMAVSATTQSNRCSVKLVSPFLRGYGSQKPGPEPCSLKIWRVVQQRRGLAVSIQLEQRLFDACSGLQQTTVTLHCSDDLRGRRMAAPNSHSMQQNMHRSSPTTRRQSSCCTMVVGLFRRHATVTRKKGVVIARSRNAFHTVHGQLADMPTFFSARRSLLTHRA